MECTIANHRSGPFRYIGFQPHTEGQIAGRSDLIIEGQLEMIAAKSDLADILTKVQARNIPCSPRQIPRKLLAGMAS